MGRRRNSLALFEVIKDRNSINNKHKSPAASSPQLLSAHTDAITSDHDTITPTIEHHGITSVSKQTGLIGFGRVLRVPVGFVIVYLGATIVLLIVAYSVGYSRGKNYTLNEEATAKMGQFNQNQINTAGSPGNDNMVNNSGYSPQNTGSNTADNNNRQSNSSNNNKTEPRVINSNNPITAENNSNNTTTNLYKDTRVKGLNYIIIEQFSSEEAVRVAEFLKKNNINVMLLKTNDRELLQVVAKQGIPGSRYSTDGVRLKQQIQLLGKDWKNQYGGTKNFDQAYGQLF